MEHLETALWRESCRRARRERDDARKTACLVAWIAIGAFGAIVGAFLAAIFSIKFLS